jgi:hypothetical protein
MRHTLAAMQHPRSGGSHTLKTIVLLLLGGAAVVVGCVAASGPPAARRAGRPRPSESAGEHFSLKGTRLEPLIASVPIPGPGSEAVRVPAGEELRAFSILMQRMFEGQADAARTQAAALGYELIEYPGPGGYLVLRERPDAFRGQGTYIVNLHYRRNIVLEAPHPIFDAGTLEEGVRMFEEVQARALFLSGAHRCANEEPTPCGIGKTDACNGRYRTSDSGHVRASFFQSAHEATLRLPDAPVAISLHEHADKAGDPVAIVSSGVKTELSPAALPNRLRRILVDLGVEARSCNLAGDGPLRLCGETNVQGRVSNGSAEPCRERAREVSGRFLHLEQDAWLLSHPHLVRRALEQLFPAQGDAQAAGGG